MYNNMDIYKNILCIKNQPLSINKTSNKHSSRVGVINNINNGVDQITFILGVFLDYPQYPQCIRMKEVLLT